MFETAPPPRAPGFWRTLGALLHAARRRAVGRARRRRQLLGSKTGAQHDSVRILAFIGSLALMAIIHFGIAEVLKRAAYVATDLELERTGRILVSPDFADAVAQNKILGNGSLTQAGAWLMDAESYHRSLMLHTDSKAEMETLVRGLVRDSDKLVGRNNADVLSLGLADGASLPGLAASIIFLWWFGMMVFQGEGLELDVLRRRHPMWEWLFSHPAPGSAIFAAEILTPVVVNPVLLAGPVFFGTLYWTLYDEFLGLAGALLVGVPLTLAAASLGKALEVLATLRLSVRMRGAAIGLMSWLGFSMLFSAVIAGYGSEDTVPKAVRTLATLGIHLPTTCLGWIFGIREGGRLSFPVGVACSWLIAAVFIGAAVATCAWSARRGIASGDQPLPQGGLGPQKGTTFGRYPLFIKELLWFRRDGSAIMQCLVLPLALAANQLYGFRHASHQDANSWNAAAGSAVLFGTYFLWALGPRSLSSEGPGLWLVQTWPGGIEALVRVKARLWLLFASSIVGALLAYDIISYPHDAWKFVLVSVGWAAFGWSMAHKTVTLVEVPSSSGEPQPIPLSRRWAASLGILSFGSGIALGQWSAAFVGIVYAWMTSAAMWQNFRARVPYLFDTWSEKPPQPPTLTQAMIAISALVESGAIVMVVVAALGYREMLEEPLVRALIAAGTAGVVAAVTAYVLENRGLKVGEVWLWNTTAKTSKRIGQVAIAALAGVALGLLAVGYHVLLPQLPFFTEAVRQSDALLKNTDLKISYAILSLAAAPIAEEYLFRGLLFRSLDREWGGWRAILGSAVFFASYHPPLAWLPVTFVGLANALIFKKTGNLFAAVALHFAYNAVVLWGTIF